MAETADPPITNGHHVGEDSSGESDMDVEKPENVILERQPKSIMKKTPSAAPVAAAPKPELPEQPNFTDLDVGALTPLSEPIIARQATINIGTIGNDG